MDAIAQNWAQVQERVDRAAATAGRHASDITVIAVTKTRPAAAVEVALAAGLCDLGENRVQETEGKKPQISTPARWHLIGRLQRNKASRAVELFDLVQSLDSPRLAAALEGHAADAAGQLDVLLQINTAGATQQGGVEPSGALDLARYVATQEHLRLRGLMTIATFTDDTDEVRRCFRQLRQVSGLIEAQHLDGVEMRWLSMGMSGDYELAIEEGSNMVRIGTAIFGPRQM